VTTVAIKPLPNYKHKLIIKQPTETVFVTHLKKDPEEKKTAASNHTVYHDNSLTEASIILVNSST